MTKVNPKSRPYPKDRAPRVDRSKMTPEEWEAHLAQKNREKSARWNERNPGKGYARLQRTRASKPWWSFILAAGDRARKRGLEYKLTPEWAARTYTGFCALTGLPFIVRPQTRGGKSGGGTYSPSIDRINPLEGYIQDNCRWVLHSINNFKGCMSDAEMLTIARALLDHYPKA